MYKMTNDEIFEHTGATRLEKFVRDQKLNWFGQICRQPNNSFTKILTFNTEVNRRSGQPLNTLRKYIFDLFKVQENEKKPNKVMKIFKKFTKQKELVIPIEQIYQKFRKRQEGVLKEILDFGLTES